MQADQLKARMSRPPKSSDEFLRWVASVDGCATIRTTGDAMFGTIIVTFTDGSELRILDDDLYEIRYPGIGAAND